MSDIPLVLSDGRGRVEIHPDRGAAVGRYDARLGNRTVDIFQTRAHEGRTGPFALGCNILMPFSNRLSGGGFRHEGTFHPVTPSLPGAAMPIHGNAFVESWTIESQRANAATLTLRSTGPGPFRYTGTVTYALHDGALEIALSVRNDGDAGLPFGIGLHPWFVRTSRTRVTLTAAGYWTEDARHLPHTYHGIEVGPWRRLAGGASLPDGWTNTAFTGWTGRARIDWPDRDCAVEIRADAALDTAILYAPSPEADYFCLEPVGHSVDAHNDHRAGSSLPTVLAPGETLAGRAVFRPEDMGDAGQAGAGRA